MLIRFVLRISTTQIAKKSDCPVKYRTSGNPINGMAQGRGDKFEDTLYKILVDMEGNNNLTFSAQCNTVGSWALRFWGKRKGRSVLAKQASASIFTFPEPVFGLSITTLRTNLRKLALKEQQISWQQNPGCWQAKLYIIEPNPGLAKFALSLRKQD